VIRAVLFDFAGTLFMPVPSSELLARAAAGLGLTLEAADRAQLGEAYDRAGVPGAPYPESVPEDLAEVYARRDLSPEEHRRAALALAGRVEQPHPGLPEAFYAELLRPQGWVPYADARGVLAELKARSVGVGLISNIGFDIRPALRAHGFGELSERVTLSYEVGAMKPARELFETAFGGLGTTPEQTLMVGDNPAADGGAVTLGARCLLLPMTPAGTNHGLELVLRLL
jgi:HAD superfamily hydrolase (TIGR01509 family)